MNIILAFLVLLSIFSESSTAAADDFYQAFAFLDSFEVCRSCKVPHDNQKKYQLTGFFQMNIRGQSPPKKVRIALGKTDKKTQYWVIRLDDEHKTVLPDGTQRWLYNYTVIHLSTEGILTVYHRLELGDVSEWKWWTESGQVYDYSAVIYGEEGKIVEQISKDFKALPKSKTDNQYLMTPYYDFSISGEFFKAMNLEGLAVPRPRFQKRSNLEIPAARSSGGNIQKIVFVVPVYREFYNQNIGALLSSIARQVHSFPGGQVHVVFNVNNTVDASKEIRVENKETADFLLALSRGDVPSVLESSDILREAIYLTLSSGLNIHVLDNTTPGYQTRNIGWVRDQTVQMVLQYLPEAQRSRTLIAHMDADSRIPEDYLSRVAQEFNDPAVQYAMTNLSFGTERGSSLQTFRRMIMSSITFANYMFRSAVGGEIPRSGSPRIISTAWALAEVGGVPHKTVGEDTQLVTNLRERFSTQGRWLHELSVEVSFRGRSDGYDASYYLKRMDEPVTLGEVEKQAEWNLLGELKKMADFPALTDDYNQRLEGILEGRQREIVARRSLLRLNISEHIRNGRVITVKPAVDLGLFTSPEFEPFMQNLIEVHEGNETKIFDAVVESFPHNLGLTLLPETKLWAELTAATETLLRKEQITAAAQKQVSPGEQCRIIFAR